MTLLKKNESFAIRWSSELEVAIDSRGERLGWKRISPGLSIPVLRFDLERVWFSEVADLNEKGKNIKGLHISSAAGARPFRWYQPTSSITFLPGRTEFAQPHQSRVQVGFSSDSNWFSL
jgi:hypothetical protein